MVRPTAKYVDEDANSIASYEEVGDEKLTRDLVVLKGGSADHGASEDEIVPDVLYVVQYRSLSGGLVDTHKSAKPLDIDAATYEVGVSGTKKPVIEILTEVTAMVRGKGGRGGHPRRSNGYHNDPYYPDYNSDDHAHKQDVSVGKVETTKMIIHSQHLRNALIAIVDYYPGVDLLGSKTTIEAPYQVLVHYKKELELYKLNQPQTHNEEYATTTAKHIDVLISFLKTTQGKDFEEEEHRWANDTPAATFNNYWMLMKPGEVIYKKADADWIPFVVSRVVTNHIGAYLVDAWHVEFVDGRMQRFMEAITIHPFNGEQAIHTLPVIPARFFPGGAKVAAERQVRLGKLYWELCKRPVYMDYEGAMEGKNGNGKGKFTGRVIVDADGYDRFRQFDMDDRHSYPPMPRKGQPPLPKHTPPKDQLPRFKSRCSCSACSKASLREEIGPFAGFEDLNPIDDQAPDTDKFYEVIVDTIPAFILAERRWSMVKVDDLQDVKVDREAFKHLVLDDDIKLTVKSLIGKFASSDGKVSPWPNDFVKNKGEGRIFLLHGSPGVGKTCTAECVAELTHRPLLSLTSGDISTSMSASSVERNLKHFLQLGERYGALVLLDEADVYLEQRRTRDLERNGLVSIFLRALEYYRGVLFLTTNRVEAFDSAFTSRIHVALHYKRLRDADRLRIWTNNFERLERDSAGKCYVPHSAREFAYQSDEVKSLRWNGREIRNALQTAVALAETEALEDGVGTVTVTDKHLRAVVKMSKGFKDYLRKNREWDEDGGDEDDDESGSDDAAENSDSVVED